MKRIGAGIEYPENLYPNETQTTLTENSQNSYKIGMPPGSLIHIGRKQSEDVSIEVFNYGSEIYSEHRCKNIEEIEACIEEGSVSWININGLHNVDLIAAIGKTFKIENLILEDMLNTNHRPSFKESKEHLFVIMKMLGLDKEGSSVVSEQVSFILGKDMVISFQEQEGDLFDPIRDSIRNARGYLRARGSDYLLYRLCDVVVDNYFYVSEYFGESAEVLEERILHNHDRETLLLIQNYKRQLVVFRRWARPLREALASLINTDSDLVKETTFRFFRDVYEHIIQIGEAIENHREMVVGIRDLYLNSVSNRMNQIMQVLTIVSTIFIPLTFIAGIYGMNFDNIPELHWKNGYFLTLGFMIMIVIAMLVFFRRRKWL